MVLGRAFNTFTDHYTSYKIFCTFITPRNEPQRTFLKVASCALSIFTLGIATFVLNFTLGHRLQNRELQAIRPPTETSLVAERLLQETSHVNHMHRLDPFSVRDLDSNNLDEVIAYNLENFSSVSPYKPCGYTEFTWAGLAAFGDRRGAAYQEFRQGLEEKVQSEVSREHFNHILSERTYPEMQGEKEFWAVDPRAVYECLVNNQDLIRRAPIETTHPGVKELRTGLLNKLSRAEADETLENKKEAARTFLQLAKIPNSLPVEIFELTFGDVKGVLPRGIRLTPELKAFHELLKEDRMKGFNLQSVRNIVSYYHRKNVQNPVAEARKVLLNLDPSFNYFVKDGRLLRTKFSTTH
jgi:hypothetical protein